MTKHAIERLLSQRIGLDPSAVGAGLIERAVSARMAARGLARPEDYDTVLRASTAEQDALIEAVVISESWFFRDELPFRVFREFVSARSPAQPVRVLSIPCAGGEEPYSLAMTLLGMDAPPPVETINAVDVSPRALEIAAQGIYRENAFRGADLAFHDCYFRPHPQGYELNPEVRRMVRFLRGNLLDPELLRTEAPYDVVFCRNLLIYLDREARRRALQTLDRLLAPEGVLFLGHAEHPRDGEPRFVLMGEPGAFAFRRAVAKEMLDPPPVRTVARKAPPPASSPKPQRRDVTARRHPRGTDQQTPPAAGAPLAPGLLDEAAALAGAGQGEQAAELCERALREGGPSAAAFFLLGMIRQTLGDPGAAEGCFRKTIYLEPKHDEALLALALLAERRGDARGAAAYRRRAARAHERKGRA
jgi:chemotaxis protein methyltransferase WspC